MAKRTFLLKSNKAGRATEVCGPSVRTLTWHLLKVNAFLPQVHGVVNLTNRNPPGNSTDVSHSIFSSLKMLLTSENHCDCLMKVNMVIFLHTGGMNSHVYIYLHKWIALGLYMHSTHIKAKSSIGWSKLKDVVRRKCEWRFPMQNLAATKE